MKNEAFFDALNYLFDRLLCRCRFLFLPIYAASKVLGGVQSAWRLLENEALKSRLGHCGTGVRLNGRITVTKPAAVQLGDNVHINHNSYIRAEGGLIIHENVHISRNLTIYTRNHDYEGTLLPYDSNNKSRPVCIGRNAWIGMNVSIMPGVTVGEGSVVGLGTVVTRDVPEFAVVVSQQPAIIKERDRRHYAELDRAGRHSGMSGYRNRWL